MFLPTNVYYKKEKMIMRKSYSWYQRYQIAMKETLSIRDIMILRDVGQPTATALSREVKEYCLKNDIPYHQIRHQRMFLCFSQAKEWITIMIKCSGKQKQSNYRILSGSRESFLLPIIRKE